MLKLKKTAKGLKLEWSEVMEFTYIFYQENLFQEAIDSKKAKVYIFDNLNNMLEAKKYYKKPFLEKESIFITFADLKEKLFLTEKIVIKERKKAIVLYEVLEKIEKEKLNIKNFFDVLSFSSEFFSFFEELNENNIKVEEIKDLKKWQREKLDFFIKVRKKYESRLEELGFIDETLLYDFKNFTLDYLKEYKDIVFVNILNFTPKERSILKRLEESGKNVQLYLQVMPEDYDEKTMRIKSLTAPKNHLVQIELFYTSEELLQIANALSLCKENSHSTTILDADFKNSSLDKLLSPEKIRFTKKISFSETKIFKFLNALYNLYQNAVFKKDTLNLEIKDLLEASLLKEFRDYYNLSEKNFLSLKDLAREGYVYLNETMFDKGIEGYKKVFEDLKKINRIESLKKFCEFLQDISLEKLSSIYLKDDISQYLDALAEIYPIEEMGIVTSWDKYFKDKTKGFFSLILSYLQYKNVNKIVDDLEAENEIEDLLAASHVNRENLIIINASMGTIPSQSEKNFLLTDSQRSKLGLQTFEERVLEEKYYFYRHIFSSQKVTIYSLKNLEKNITSSPFVEELRLKYSLKEKEAPLKEASLPEIVKNIFASQENIFKNYLEPQSFKDDTLLIEAKDFPKEYFTLSYYKYNSLKTCFYKFYLEHIAQLETEIELNKVIDRMTLGILAHEIYEEVFKNLKILNNKFSLEKELLEKICLEKFHSYSLKINNFYKKYYEKVLLEKIKESVFTFLNELNKRISGEIKNVISEWSPPKNTKPLLETELVDFYLSGRIDLVVETENTKYIFDYKTGSGNTEQLDFYELLLNPELKADYKFEKYFYEIFKEEFSASDKKLLKEDVIQILTDFLETGEYKPEYRPECKRCSYLDICKVVSN